MGDNLTGNPEDYVYFYKDEVDDIRFCCPWCGKLIIRQFPKFPNPDDNNYEAIIYWWPGWSLRLCKECYDIFLKEKEEKERVKRKVAKWQAEFEKAHSK